MHLNSSVGKLAFSCCVVGCDGGCLRQWLPVCSAVVQEQVHGSDSVSDEHH